MKYELTHDLLAAKVEEKASDEQKIRRKMRRFLNEQYEQYTQGQTLLSKEDLEYIRPYLKLLHVSDDERSLIRKSELALKKRQRILLAIVTGIFIVISSLGLKAWFESKKYQAQFLNARARQVLSQDPTVSLRMSEEAYDLYQDSAIRQDMFEVYRNYVFYQTILRLKAPIKIAQMSPDGKQFLTVTQVQMEPELWEMTGLPVTRLKGHEHPVLDVAYSPDGKWMVSAGNDKTAILWDSLGNLVQRFSSKDKSQDPDIRAVDVSENGEWVLTGASTGKLKLWRNGADEPFWTGDVQSEINDVSLNARASRFAVAGANPELHFFVKNEEGIKHYQISGHEAAVKSIKFSNDGSLLASGSADKSVRLWSVDDSVIFKQKLGEHRGSVQSLGFSPDGNWLISGGTDSTARLWHMNDRNRKGPVLTGHKGAVNSVGFGPLSNQVMTASVDSTLRLWNAPDREPIQEIDLHRRGVNVVAFSQDGTKLASGGADKRVGLFDLINKTTLLAHREHQDPVIAVSISMGQDFLFSIDEFGIVIKYNIKEQQVDTTFKTHADEVFDADFSLDGKYLFTGSRDNTAKLWYMSTGQEIRTLTHEGAVFSVAIDAKNTRLLSGCEDSTVYVWDIQGKQIQALNGHSGEVLTVAFMPVSGHILSGSKDQSVILWDQDGKVKRFADVKLPVNSLSISKTENILVVGYIGDQTTLYDREGYAIGALAGHGDFVNSVSFSSNGKWIATASDDKKIRIWELSKLTLSTFLSNNHLDPLTQN